MRHARIHRIDVGREPEEADVIKILQKEANKRRDSAEQYHKVNRADMAAEEEAGLAILEAYLPKMLDAATLRPLVAEVIAEVGATSLADLSKLMPALMQRFKGQAEGRTLNEVARELLSA